MVRLLCALVLALNTCSGGGASGAAPSRQLAENTSAANVKTYSAAAFVDSIGVNIHVAYTDTPYYANWTGVLAALSASGIKHIRDSFPADWKWTSPYAQLAAAGIDASVITPANTSRADMQAFASSGVSIAGWEGPNELDATDRNYAADLAAWAPAFYARAKSVTPNVPVIAPSLSQPNRYQNISDLSAWVDKANAHVYPSGWNPGNAGYGAAFYGYPWGTTQFYIEGAHQDVLKRTKGIWFTETGYSNTGTGNTIPEAVSGRYIPRVSLWDFIHGVDRAYFYEFLNEDQFGVSNPESGYGLVHWDLTPKPGFTVLKALIAKCADANSPAVLSPFPLTINGTPPSDVTSALFQKSRDRYVFVIWRELPSWYPIGAKPIAVNPTNVTLRLDATRLGSSVIRTTFDDSGAATQSTLPLASDGTATISVDDHVQTLEFASASVGTQSVKRVSAATRPKLP
jgi:hypothetical protein